MITLTMYVQLYNTITKLVTFICIGHVHTNKKFDYKNDKNE